ncbi:MAG: OadG family protein [Aminipila sp.]
MEATLMDKFADPALFDTLSFSDKAIGALITTCMGMGITFIVLVLLWGVVALMSKGLGATEKKNKEQVTSMQSEKQEPIVAKLEENNELENAQLVAVITAAIEAYEGNKGCYCQELIVRNIRRIGESSWSNAGKNECAMSRKMY